MLRQFCRLDLHQIGFHMLDDALTNKPRQQIYNRGGDRRRRRKWPALGPRVLHDLRDVLGQLFKNPTIVFRLESLTLSNRILVAAAPRLSATIADRKSAGLIGQLVLIATVGV